MPKPDVTKLGWFDRTIDGCIVDSIPAGDAPKFVKVVLPGTDGSIIPVWWTGFPALAVSDTVSVRYSPGNAAQYVISGTSGATVSNGGGWPFDNVFAVSATNPGADFASIQDANDDAGVGSGDALALDAETFSEALTISKALAIVAAMLGQCSVTDATNSAPTVNNSSAGVRLTGLAIYHTGAGTTAGCLYSASNNFFANMCTFSKTSGASGTAYGLWINGGSNVIVDNCILVASSGSGSNFGGYVTGGAVTLLDCTVTGSGSGTVRSLYITGGSVIVDGGYYVGSLEHDNVSGSIDLRGPTLISGFTNTAGTARGWYYDAGGNINFVGSSVISGLDKAAVAKLWESDSGAVAWQTNAAGDLLGQAGVDVRPNSDAYGLWTRYVNKGVTPIEHYSNGTEDAAWTGWASYTGFATPSTQQFSRSAFGFYHSSTARKFRYRAYLNHQAIIYCRVAADPGQLAGVMVDDGVGNADGLGADNFVRWMIEAASGGNWNYAVERRTGGGAVTKTTYASVPPAQFYTLALLYGSGTRWSNWAAYWYIMEESSLFSLFNLGSVTGQTWTPSRIGIYSGPGANLRGIFDWYHEV